MRVVCSARGTPGVPGEWSLCRGYWDGGRWWLAQDRPLEQCRECLLHTCHPLRVHIILKLFHLSCHCQVVPAGLQGK